MLISTFTHRAGAALGIAVFAWLLLTFLGDLGVMGTAVATRMPVSVLFLSALLNPVEAFRLASLTAFSGTLDVLGPAGLYASRTYGVGLPWIFAGALAAWTVVPLGLAFGLFTTRGDV